MATKLPEPSCPRGYTDNDLARIFTDDADLRKFSSWMSGQTVAICDGRKYNYERGQYEPTECAATPHGLCTYTWDVARYLGNRDNGDLLIWD